jgi:hypothetical protein
MAFRRPKARARVRFAALSETDDAQTLEERSHRTFTEAHASLLQAMRIARGDAWSDRALLACLGTLQTSTLTEAWCVAIEDAWTEARDALCVLYRARHAGPGLVGLRRTRADVLAALASEAYEPGDFVDVGMYDLGDPHEPNPESFGRTVADFDIGEPLGTIWDRLRYDNHGTGWWGTLGHELPRRP